MFQFIPVEVERKTKTALGHNKKITVEYGAALCEKFTLVAFDRFFTETAFMRDIKEYLVLNIQYLVSLQKEGVVTFKNYVDLYERLLHSAKKIYDKNIELGVLNAKNDILIKDNDRYCDDGSLKGVEKQTLTQSFAYLMNNFFADFYKVKNKELSLNSISMSNDHEDNDAVGNLNISSISHQHLQSKIELAPKISTNKHDLQFSLPTQIQLNNA